MSLFEPFLAWEAADFDAFAEARWRSNRFNLERARVRHRMLSLVDQTLTAAGLDRAGLEVWSSLDHPALVNDHAVRQQTVLLCRAAGQREAIQARDLAVSASEPDRCHAHVGLVVDADGLTLQLRVPEGARNDQPSIAQFFGELNELATAVAGCQVRVDGSAADADAFLAKASQSEPFDLALALHAERSDLCAGAWTVAGVADWLARVVPVFRLLVGPPDDSRVSDAAAADAPVDPPPPNAAPPGNPRATGPVPDGRGYRPFGRPPPPTKVAPPPPPKPAKVGARVKLVTGAFAGKIGTVTAVQGGQIVVALGLLTAKVAPQDVKVL